jgi:predicted nucleic acid-binding protein
VIVLDTSILSLAFRRRSIPDPAPLEVRVLQKMIADDVPVRVPGIVLQELLAGTRTDAHCDRLERLMSGFRLLPATLDDHVRAAHIANTCRRRGVAASTIDCLIAAQTIAAHASLFSLDADLARIAPHVGLQLFDPNGRAVRA